MYSLNATTGALAEVSGSPFAGSTLTGASSIAAEPSGQFVYVLKYSPNDAYPANSIVTLDTFSVDSANLQLLAQPSLSIPLNGTLVDIAASSHGFYLLVNQDDASSPYPLAVLDAILFDPATGQASGLQPLVNKTSNNGLALLLDSSGKNLVISAGLHCGSLWFVQLSGTDGAWLADNSLILPCEEFANPFAFDPPNKFLYATFTIDKIPSPDVHVFDLSTQMETASSPVPASLESDLGGQPNPQAPFSFLMGPAPASGILVFGVDPATGYPVPLHLHESAIFRPNSRTEPSHR